MKEENERQTREIEIHQAQVLFPKPDSEKAMAKEKAIEELTAKVASLEKELAKKKEEKKANEGIKVELEKMKKQWTAVTSIIDQAKS